MSKSSSYYGLALRGILIMGEKMKFNAMWAAALLALAAWGCGGGGSSSGGTSGGTGGNANVAVYATDAPNPNFAHVWITVYSVDLVNQSGGTVNVFSSSSGLTLDARALRDGDGELFEFIDAAGVPMGSYIGAKVTVDNNVEIVQSGQVSTTTRQFFNSNSAGQGKTFLSVNFKSPFMANGSNPLALDFDLASWTIDSQGLVHAVVTLGPTNVGVMRQHARQLEGIVQSLSGTPGSQTFTLVHDENRSLEITTTASTTIFNANGKPNPVLSNGERVHITGTFANGVFTASTIMIQNGERAGHQVDVTGAFSNLDAASGAFTLTVMDTDDFAPGTITVNVVTNSNTTFLSNGVSEDEATFFSDLGAAPSGSQVEVVGTVSGSTITATTIRLIPPLSSVTGVPAEVGGTVTSSDASSGTFTVSAASWQGVALGSGASVTVVTNPATTYFNLNGSQVASTDWFGALGSANRVEAFGTYSNGTLTASAVVIGTDDGDHGHGHHGHGHGHGDGGGV